MSVNAHEPTLGLPYAARAQRLTGSVIDSSTSLLERQTHDIVRFAMGSPAEEAIPARELCEIAGSVLGADMASSFDYGPSEGETALREHLAALLAAHGQEVPLERLLITAGGMQGIDLVCKLFVDPGDTVIVEAPTYTNGSATIASYEGDIVEIPIDDDGMQVDVLEEHVRRTRTPPKLIYTIPTFQNPSGTTLSLERRRRLLELAERWGSIVLEDDPYSLLRFSGTALPSLAQLSGHAPWVVGVHTFSKILAPGLRVGWIVAAPDIIERMVAAKQAMDTCTNVPCQRLVSALLGAGGMEQHVERLRMVYLERKEGMQAALAATFPESDVTWTDPQGGFFLWLTLGSDVDTSDLFPAALAQGVAYIPGRAFSVNDRFRNSLRLCFASTTPERTVEGVHRLRRALVSWRDEVTNRS
jgi:2-aminoadipate transaminase